MRSLLVVLLLLPACKKTDGISRDLGASCQSHADCAERCLPEPRWPTGFCSLSCAATDDCPVGADCVTTSDGDVCLFICFDDRDCAFLEATGADSVWRCRSLSGPGGTVMACAPAAAGAP